MPYLFWECALNFLWELETGVLANGMLSTDNGRLPKLHIFRLPQNRLTPNISKLLSQQIDHVTGSNENLFTNTNHRLASSSVSKILNIKKNANMKRI